MKAATLLRADVRGAPGGGGLKDEFLSAMRASANSIALLSQTRILSLPGIKKAPRPVLLVGGQLRFRGDCRRYQSRAVQNLKERTEPGPSSNAGSGARSAKRFSEFYDTITCLSLAYVSGHRRSIVGHDTTRNR